MDNNYSELNVLHFLFARRQRQMLREMKEKNKKVKCVARDAALCLLL